MRSRNALISAAIVVPCLLGQSTPLMAQSTPVLSPSEVAVACSPSLTLVPERPPVHDLRVVGAQDTVPRSLFGMRDTVIISGGTNGGVELNQQYAIRRAFKFGHIAKGQLQTIHTAGWLRIVAVNEATSVALVEQVCDGVLTGDYLEPFVAPAPATGGAINTTADLDFASSRRVLFGDEERRLAAPGDFVMLDSGAGDIAPGTRVAVYRDLKAAGVPLVAIGEGVIVTVTNGTPVMRVTTTRDAIRGGDYVVTHK